LPFELFRSKPPDVSYALDENVLLICPCHVVEDVEELIHVESLIHILLIQDWWFRLGVIRGGFDRVLGVIIPWSGVS
jgi:hypothetical protein